MIGLGLNLGLGLGAQGGGGAWSPSSLGASLLAFWDAEATSSLTLAGSLVTTWTDTKGSYAQTQATSGFKPAYSATSFNGRPGLTPDGTDDYLGLESQPFGSSFEIWALVDQTALVADTGVRALVGIGGSLSASRVTLQRAVASGVNRAQLNIGTGGGSVAVTHPTLDFSGRHVIRAVIGPTEANLYGDGVSAGAATAAVPSLGTTRTRLFATTSTVAGNFWQGGANAVLITQMLDAGQATNLTNFLKTRGGIA